MRVEGWERRLAAIIKSGERIPFQWGLRDCALFAADCVTVVTGKDPAAAWRGKYADEASARRLIAEAGGLAAMVEAGMRAAGIAFERVAPAFGQRGDPCLYIGQLGETLAVVEGRMLVGQAEHGLDRAPFDTATLTWALR